MKNDMFSIPQAAEYCAISRGTLWRWVKSGDLPASYTPGGHYRIYKKDLESFMRDKKMRFPDPDYSQGRKILIVDDDATIQQLLTEVLSSVNYQTDVASDGFEAGIKIMDFNPSLIILDLFMPKVDGFEVCRRIKQDTKTSHIQILAITGYGSRENKERILKAGADGYLVKPVKNKTLLQHVKTLLDNR